MAQGSHFNRAYFGQFTHNLSPIKKKLLTLIDKKEPLLSWLKKEFKHGSTLVDYGCGRGAFLRYAEDHFACVGIDISKDAIAMAKKVLRSSTLLIGDERELEKLKHVDVVCLFDVLEHIQDFKPVLEAAHRSLKADGVLILSVPNADSIALKYLGKRWWAFADTSHCWLLPARVWERRLAEHGFMPLRTFSSGLINHPDLDHTLTGVWKVFHLVTQTLALLRLPLPNRFNDILYLMCRKNPYFTHST